jgi:hypothetical protein
VVMVTMEIGVHRFFLLVAVTVMGLIAHGALSC